MDTRRYQLDVLDGRFLWLLHLGLQVLLQSFASECVQLRLRSPAQDRAFHEE
jgi:hypothetical protein